MKRRMKKIWPIIIILLIVIIIAMLFFMIELCEDFTHGRNIKETPGLRYLRF